MSELTEFRKAKDEFFGKDHQSPLTAQQRQRFTRLTYYQENPSLQFVVTIEELPESQREVIQMVTSTGESQPRLRWGTINFTVEGQSATLTVYRDEDGGEFFLPFADTTNGEETYGAGRYLDLIPLEHGQILLDFNYAYSPYCAYNPLWSCPIPPAENRLKMPILAGEKNFPDAVAH